MSDVLNHYYCARETYKQLSDNQAILNIINRYYDAYRLGSQGPDFFYYGILSKSSVLSAKIGHLLHTDKVNEFFYYGLKFAQDNPVFKDITLAYLFGFATHFSLDVLTHPFIYYRTGTDSNQVKEKMKSHKFHKYYEILLDTAMLSYRFKRKAANQKPQKVFDVTPFTFDFLMAFYHYILEKIYSIDLPKKVIGHALKMSGLLIGFFTDKLGIVKTFGKPIERILHDNKLFTRFFYPDSADENIILNLDNNEWFDPISQEKHTDSYLNLFNKAVSKASYLINQLESLVDNKTVELEDINDLFENRSYLTGHNCTQEGKQNIYDEEFKNYLEKL